MIVQYQWFEILGTYILLSLTLILAINGVLSAQIVRLGRAETKSVERKSENHVRGVKWFLYSIFYITPSETFALTEGSYPKSYRTLISIKKRTSIFVFLTVAIWIVGSATLPENRQVTFIHGVNQTDSDTIAYVIQNRLHVNLYRDSLFVHNDNLVKSTNVWLAYLIASDSSLNKEKLKTLVTRIECNNCFSLRYRYDSLRFDNDLNDLRFEDSAMLVTCGFVYYTVSKGISFEFLNFTLDTYSDRNLSKYGITQPLRGIHVFELFQTYLRTKDPWLKGTYEKQIKMLQNVNRHKDNMWNNTDQNLKYLFSLRDNIERYGFARTLEKLKTDNAF